MQALRRKIETTLREWKNSSDRYPLIIKGCRQCGKTFSVKKFATDNYRHVVYINFVESPSLAISFNGSKKVDDIVMNLSSVMENVSFVAGKTCIILDEIQECPEARTALKFFKLDGRYDVIATGSLLGVKGYKSNAEHYSSVPVGYETIVEMYPLDFEEFLWANGIGQNVVEFLRNCFENETPVTQAIHERLKQLLLHYVIVGGMPRVVTTFVETKDINKVIDLQHMIVDAYKDDMIKYAPDNIKSQIRECFDSIPRQLSKENKKFQYSVVEKGAKAKAYGSALQWIEDAGIITRCYNLSIPELPLDGNALDGVFKVYVADTGLFLSMLERGTQADVLQGKLYGYKGAIYENLVADIFHKMRRRLYYYRKDSGLEIDFVIRHKGEATLVEVKATTGNAKSVKTILNHPEKYHVNRAIKMGDYNVGHSNNILTLPLYMAFLLSAV